MRQEETRDFRSLLQEQQNCLLTMAAVNIPLPTNLSAIQLVPTPCGEGLGAGKEVLKKRQKNLCLRIANIIVGELDNN